MRQSNYRMAIKQTCVSNRVAFGARASRSLHHETIEHLHAATQRRPRKHVIVWQSSNQALMRQSITSMRSRRGRGMGSISLAVAMKRTRDKLKGSERKWSRKFWFCNRATNQAFGHSAIEHPIWACPKWHAPNMVPDQRQEHPMACP
eukprot:5019626-Prymnesium_polylepis.1